MSAADITARLVAALEAAAAREGSAALVSVNVELLTQGGGGEIQTRVLRKTRTLLFMAADWVNASGAPIATASSVHKLEG